MMTDLSVSHQAMLSNQTDQTMPEAIVRGVHINYEVIGTSGPWISLTPGSRRPYAELVSLSKEIAANGYRVLLAANGGSQRRLLTSPRLWDMSPDWGSSRGRRGCTITGTINADDLVGTPRADVICGLGGSDRLRGLGGNDVLIGGAGADRLEGGPGRDTASVDSKRDALRSIERRVKA